MSVLPLPKSHLPIHIDLRQSKVLVIDVGADELPEPFQSEAAQRLLSAGCESYRMDLADFVACYGSGSADWAPTPLVISHVGRCGSTLLSRSLDTAPDVFVHREPPLLGPIFRAVAGLANSSRTQSSGQAEPQLMELQSMLSAALSALGAFAVHRRSASVVKLTSWHGAFINEIGLDEHCHQVLLLHRQPHAVVASSLLNPPDWAAEALDGVEPLLLGSRPSFAAATTPPLSASRYFCGIWNAVVDEAVELSERWDGVRSLSYDSFVADPKPVVESLLGAVASGRCDPEALERVLGSYSKSTEDIRYEPAGQHSVLELTTHTLREIKNITSVPVTSLNHRVWRFDEN